MRELIQENTGAAIGVAVCIGLVALISFLVQTDGPVQEAFVNLINAALTKAGATAITP